MHSLLSSLLLLVAVATLAMGELENKEKNSFGAESREYSTSNSANFEPVYTSSYVPTTTSYTRPSYTGYSSGYYPSESYAYNNDVGLFGGDLISTGVSILVGLFAFSILIQIVTKVFALPVFENVLEARSLDANQLVEMANMAAKAIEKFERLNQTNGN